MSIAEQFEHKIESGELSTPLPPSLFVLKRIGLWALFALVVILGVTSAGVAVWFILDPADLVVDAENVKILSSLLDVLPLFWVGVSLACGLIAVWAFSKSSHGYRYKIMSVSAACLVAFLALGAALASSGLADKVDAIASSIMPPYRDIARPRLMRFMQPERGMIIGRIVDMDATSVRLGDPRGDTWQVQITNQTHLPKMQPLETGECVSVLGYVSTDTQVTQAMLIRPCPRGVHPNGPPPPLSVPPK